MAKALDDVKRDLRNRLKELEPLVKEYEQLQRADLALNFSEPQEAPAGRPRSNGKARKPAKTSAKRAPRGANKEKVYGVISERPGVSVGEIAQASGVGKPIIYNITRAGIEKGELEKVDLGGGRAGFRYLADAS